MQGTFIFKGPEGKISRLRRYLSFYASYDYNFLFDVYSKLPPPMKLGFGVVLRNWGTILDLIGWDAHPPKQSKRENQ